MKALYAAASTPPCHRASTALGPRTGRIPRARVYLPMERCSSRLPELENRTAYTSTAQSWTKWEFANMLDHSARR
jgi:hypothetical protein